MVRVKMSTFKPELDVVIAEVKEQFRLFLTKRSELVLRLGHAYEQVVGDVESICEEIKNILHDEIVQKLISRRDIERYCPDEWKRRTKPKNDNLSFSLDNGSRRKNLNHRKIKATTTTEGITVMEPFAPASLQLDAAPSATSKQETVEKFDVTNILPEYNVPVSGIGYDGLTSHELLGGIQQLQKEVTYLNERCNNFSQQPIQPRTVLSECSQCTKYAIQIQELMDDAGTEDVVTPNELEFEFSMHFEGVRRYMMPIFEINKGFGEVWFHGILDSRTGKVISVSTGRWSDNFQNNKSCS